jgi:hypothetical protein
MDLSRPDCPFKHVLDSVAHSAPRWSDDSEDKLLPNKKSWFCPDEKRKGQKHGGDWDARTKLLLSSVRRQDRCLSQWSPSQHIRRRVKGITEQSPERYGKKNCLTVRSITVSLIEDIRFDKCDMYCRISGCTNEWSIEDRLCRRQMSHGDIHV